MSRHLRVVGYLLIGTAAAHFTLRALWVSGSRGLFIDSPARRHGALPRSKNSPGYLRDKGK
jgi:hypothetical protein